MSDDSDQPKPSTQVFAYCQKLDLMLSDIIDAPVRH